MYANGRRRNIYDFWVCYVRGVAYISARRVIFYMRDVFFVLLLRMRFDVTLEAEDEAEKARVTWIDVSICNRTNKRSITDDFFLSAPQGIWLLAALKVGKMPGAPQDFHKFMKHNRRARVESVTKDIYGTSDIIRFICFRY